METDHTSNSQEGIAVGRTFAALNDYQVDGNKEMIAIGLMNMAGSCSSCYVTTGKHFSINKESSNSFKLISFLFTCEPLQLLTSWFTHIAPFTIKVNIFNYIFNIFN